MTWPAPLVPSHPPRAEEGSNASIATPNSTPWATVTIQASRASNDAEGMASRIERLQKSRGGVKGNTRERLYRKLVEEGLITARGKVKEQVERGVKELEARGNEGMGSGQEGNEGGNAVNKGLEEMEREKEKSFGGVGVARNARENQPRGVDLQKKEFQGKAKGEAIGLCGSGGEELNKRILMPQKQCDSEEGILKLDEPQLDSYDQQQFKVYSPLASHNTEPVRALVSLVEHTNSPFDLAGPADLNSDKWASCLGERGLLTSQSSSRSPWGITTNNNPITTQQSTATPLSASQQKSSIFSNANRVIVSSVQQPGMTISPPNSNRHKLVHA